MCAKRYLKWLQQHNDLDDTASTGNSRSAPRSLQLGIYVRREPDTQQSNNDDPPRSQHGNQALRIVHEHTFDARLTGDALTGALMTFEETDDIEAYKEALVAAFRLNITFQNIRPLQKSERFGDLAELALMINEVNRDHAFINAVGRHEMPILHQACCAGLADLLEPLFWRGASFGTDVEFYRTPLFQAVGSGDLDTVVFALALGADPNLRYNFTFASIAKRGDIVMALVKYGADVNEKDWNGETALDRAIDDESLDGVRFLLSLGADADLATYDAAHPMFRMTRRCKHRDYDDCVHEQIALTLLEHGSGLSCQDQRGATIFDLAVYETNIRLLRALLKRITSLDVLDANDNDDQGIVLQRAVRVSNACLTLESSTVVSMLLEAGADINARTHDEGYTALDLAVEDGNEALVKLLLDAGASINYPALTRAAGRGDKKSRANADRCRSSRVCAKPIWRDGTGCSCRRRTRRGCSSVAGCRS
jgi:ankyrin repeat protein